MTAGRLIQLLALLPADMPVVAVFDGFAPVRYFGVEVTTFGERFSLEQLEPEEVALRVAVIE